MADTNHSSTTIPTATVLINTLFTIKAMVDTVRRTVAGPYDTPEDNADAMANVWRVCGVASSQIQAMIQSLDVVPNANTAEVLADTALHESEQTPNTTALHRRVAHGLTILASAREFLDDKINDSCTAADSAALSLVQEAGAALEPALKALGALKGSGIVGDEADWLGLRRERAEVAA